MLCFPGSKRCVPKMMRAEGDAAHDETTRHINDDDAKTMGAHIMPRRQPSTRTITRRSTRTYNRRVERRAIATSLSCLPISREIQSHHQHISQYTTIISTMQTAMTTARSIARCVRSTLNARRVCTIHHHQPVEINTITSSTHLSIYTLISTM